MTQKMAMTADDLYALSSGHRCELVEGKLIEMSPAAPEHGQAAARITVMVGGFIEQHRLGWYFAAETGFRLQREPDTVRAPDFAFVARGRITPSMDPIHYFDLAPDLAVEVVSPNDSATDVMKKVAEYLEAGVRLVWIFYPRLRSVQVFPGGRMFGPQAELSGADVVPAFTCRVEAFFATPGNGA